MFAAFFSFSCLGWSSLCLKLFFFFFACFGEAQFVLGLQPCNAPVTREPWRSREYNPVVQSTRRALPELHPVRHYPPPACREAEGYMGYGLE